MASRVESCFSVVSCTSSWGHLKIIHFHPFTKWSLFRKPELMDCYVCLHWLRMSSAISLATGVLRPTSFNLSTAVRLWLSATQTSIPASNKVLTTSTFPHRAASWSAVPCEVRALASNPALTKASTTALFIFTILWMQSFKISCKIFWN